MLEEIIVRKNAPSPPPTISTQNTCFHNTETCEAVFCRVRLHSIEYRYRSLTEPTGSVGEGMDVVQNLHNLSGISWVYLADVVQKLVPAPGNFHEGIHVPRIRRVCEAHGTHRSVG